MIYKNKDINSLHEEKWHPIHGLETYYAISNMGRVKSLKRVTSQGVLLQEKILSQFFNIDKYLCVNLYRDGKKKQVKVHRLVGEHFIDNPENKPQINHKSGIKTDNRHSQLEWSTIQENNQHAWDIGLKKPSEYQKSRVRECNKGGNSYKAKLLINLETGVFYDTIGEAALAINMKRQTLNAMLVGKNRNKTSLIYA